VRGQVPYRTYLRYAGGLAPGAAVLFGGIKVGQVIAVRPASADPTRIEIAFEIKGITSRAERDSGGEACASPAADRSGVFLVLSRFFPSSFLIPSGLPQPA
jgi:hypothetical protein